MRDGLGLAKLDVEDFYMKGTFRDLSAEAFDHPPPLRSVYMKLLEVILEHQASSLGAWHCLHHGRICVPLLHPFRSLRSSWCTLTSFTVCATYALLFHNVNWRPEYLFRMPLDFLSLKVVL